MFPIAPNATDLFLGPGTVLEVAETGGVRATISTGTVSAEMALPMPYQPKEGDILLIVGQEDRHYVIGVLHAVGGAAYRFPADVNWQAPNGSINISAGDTVTTQATEVETRAGRITIVAESLTQRLGALYRWVKGLVHIRGGRKHAVYEDTIIERAENIHVRADEDVKVTGKRIHLG